MDPIQKVILFQWPKVSYRLCWEKPYQKVISKVWINPLRIFYPNSKAPFAEVVTMGYLSRMSSGLNWDEDYDTPLSLIADAYYTSDLKSLVLDQPINTIPGEAFIYKSGATQLLGMAMENALDQKLNRYLNKSF